MSQQRYSRRLGDQCPDGRGADYAQAYHRDDVGHALADFCIAIVGVLAMAAIALGVI